MGDIIVSTEILGQTVTEVLHREVNALCFDKKIDGDEVWKKIIDAKHIDELRDVLKEYFGKEIRLI